MHPNLQHILTLAQLMRFGARGKYVDITTTELGNFISRSQQSASNHLVELEKAGLVERTKAGQKFKVRVTEKGCGEVHHLHEIINGAVERLENGSLQFEGRVVSGMGEGAYYMSLEGYQKRFKEKLGYHPYAGTLNVRLQDKSHMHMRDMLDDYPSVFIDGFRDSSRSFGWVKCYPAVINDGIINKAAAIVLERTHYDNSMLEVIAPISIKDRMGIKDGEIIKVTVMLNSPRN